MTATRESSGMYSTTVSSTKSSIMPHSSVSTEALASRTKTISLSCAVAHGIGDWVGKTVGVVVGVEVVGETVGETVGVRVGVVVGVEVGETVGVPLGCIVGAVVWTSAQKMVSSHAPS